MAAAAPSAGFDLDHELEEISKLDNAPPIASIEESSRTPVVDTTIALPSGHRATAAVAKKSKSKLGLAASYAKLYEDTPWWKMSLALLTAIAAGVPLPIMSFVTGQVIDDFGSNFDSVKNKVWILVLIAVAFFFLSWSYMALFSQIGMKNGVRLRESYVQALLHAEVYDVEGRGAEVSSKLGSSIHLVQSGTGDKAGLLLQSISYFVTAFIVGFIRNATLTAILLPVVPVFLIIVTIGSRYTEKYNARVAAATLRSTNFAQEAFKNIRLLKTLNAQRVLSERFGETTSALIRDSILRATCGALMTGCIYLVIYLTNALAFWEGARLIVSQDQSGAGSTYVVVSLVIDSSFVVGMVSPFLQVFATAAAAGEEIRQEVRYSRETLESHESGDTLNDDYDGQITFAEVSFSYPSALDVPVLKNFNLTLGAGKFIGIVGQSGSCKSTVINLIERFYQCQEGQILIDGTDIASLKRSSWRKQISLVSQEPVLFTGTIFENIARGLTKTSDASLSEPALREMVKLAAEKAHAAVFIDTLEKGYDTQVGSNGGTKLSVGQRQRITLARALISEPRILLLDEATSAVDALSERYIAEALHQPSSTRRTTVVVAHRLTTVKDADEIVVMHEGQIVEQGSHQELLDLRGRYSQMVSMQSMYSKQYGQEADEDIETITNVSDDDLPGKGIAEEQPAEELTQAITASTVAQKIYQNCKKENKWIILGLLSSCVTGCITSADALLFGNLIPALNDTSRPDYLKSRAAFLAAFFVLIGGAAIIGYTLMGSAFGVSSVKLTQRVKKQVFEHLVESPISFHDDESNSADRVSSRLESDTAALGGLSGQFIGSAISVIVSIASGTILAHVVAPLIAVVLLPAVPLIIVSGFLRLKVAAKNQHRNEVAFESSAALASEAINNIKTVASLSIEADIFSRYQAMLESTYTNTWKYMAASTSLLALAYTLPFIIYALAYLWGAYMISKGRYDTKDYFIVLPALLFSAQTSGQMFSMAPDFSRATIAAKSIFRTLSQHVEDATCNASYKANPESRGEIEFKNVSFKYPSRDEYIIKDLSFVIPAGHRVAFVGRSGCGKTTLFSLLSRFYEPTSGQILIDDMDILQHDLFDLRTRISYVPQESSVFTGSVRFNLSLANPTASDVEFQKACEKAQIWDFVTSLPQGLDTVLGSGTSGVTVSGGQRQRLAIARAFLTPSKIMLLDEPTAALDAFNEKLIDRALKTHGSSRTMIQIAHRLGGIVDSDTIMVFDAGRLVDSGKHGELLQRGGLYGELIASMM